MTDPALLTIRGLSKTFPGSRALVAVDIDVRRGDVHALMGHNGSGKSTLIKTLSGFHVADPGYEAWFRGERVELAALQRRDDHGYLGLAVVHQDLGLIHELSAVENFALHASARYGRVGPKQLAERLAAVLEPLAPVMDLTRLMSTVTPVERTMIAIAIALDSLNPEGGVLILDEPTATLPAGEVQKLSAVVRQLRDAGTGVLYVSHRLDEIFDLADRVTVLREGYRVAERPVSSLTRAELVQIMVGDEVARTEGRREERAAGSGQTCLAVEGLSGAYAQDITFTLRQNEIVGLAGLAGSGSDEVPRLLTADCRDARQGRVRVGTGEWQPVRRSKQTREIALVPADRGRQGVISEMSVVENLTISVVGTFGTGRLSGRREDAEAGSWISRLGVLAPSPQSRIQVLSGGNQQKIVVGRALSRQPSILVVCEPTAGVDIGARQEIYKTIHDHVDRGLGVLVNSSDVGDLVALCDRVLIFHEGSIVAELTGDKITEKSLVQAMEERNEEHVDH